MIEGGPTGAPSSQHGPEPRALLPVFLSRAGRSSVVLLVYNRQRWPGSQCNTSLCIGYVIFAAMTSSGRGSRSKRKARFGGNGSSGEKVFPAAKLRTAEAPSSPSLFLNQGKKGSEHMGKILTPGAADKPLAVHVS